MNEHSLVDRVDRLCEEAARDLPADWSARIEDIRRRLQGPIRIAIAGRVKAGKSTLLNALVGERLAPTDAGECTRIVTWYEYAPAYEVTATTRHGQTFIPRFRKGETALEIELETPDEVDRLKIGWPARRLSQATYIDTPGLGSLSPPASAATREFLGVEDRPSQADAVVYLMRHAHIEDARFLEGFRDAGLPLGSPVNTVAVLSRADEIGAGRLDALDSARIVAGRYQQDERLRHLAGEVLPLAGLLAETGASLGEQEFLTLRQLAFDTVGIDDLLLSVDRFRNPEMNPLAAELRERALARLGLFGVRLVVTALRNDEAKTSQELSQLLLDRSGIFSLRHLIETKFTSRSRLLVARSVLLDLRSLATELRGAGMSASDRLESALEEVVASAHEIAELELLHGIGVGVIPFDDAERAEAHRLIDEHSVSSRLGLDMDAPVSAQQAAALSSIERWRERRANPFLDRDAARACEVMARSYEGIYARLLGTSQ